MHSVVLCCGYLKAVVRSCINWALATTLLVKFFSEHPSTASRILLTDDMQFMVAIESYQIILWRMVEANYRTHAEYLADEIDETDDDFNDAFIGDYTFPRDVDDNRNGLPAFTVTDSIGCFFKIYTNFCRCFRY